MATVVVSGRVDEEVKRKVDRIIEKAGKTTADVIRDVRVNGEFGMSCVLPVKDVYYLLAKPYGEVLSRDYVKALLGLVAIVPVDAEICDMARRSDGPEFEDGIVRACAELNGADFIITRDKDAYAHSKIKSASPKRYLEIASASGALSFD